jgi:hypothetical protein
MIQNPKYPKYCISQYPNIRISICSNIPISSNIPIVNFPQISSNSGKVLEKNKLWDIKACQHLISPGTSSTALFLVFGKGQATLISNTLLEEHGTWELENLDPSSHSVAESASK